MKLHLFRYYRFVIAFFMICTLILVYSLQAFADDSIIPQNSQVEATISNGQISVVIKEEDIADSITVSVMPFIAESFVGYNDVIPGLKKEGILEIKNETGETYKVIDYNFTAKITNLKRIYNDAAKSHFGSSSLINYEKVIALSGDEWYQINSEYFGEENFNNMDVLRKMFGWGDATQGVALSGYETGQKMIDLGFHYLFQNCIQFSFDTNTDPVNNYNTKNINILDYINKGDANKVLVLNKFFADGVGDENLLMDIGYSMDNSSIGNAYNSAYADFGFELILERVVNKEPEISEPEISEPEISEPEISEPEISEPEIIEPEKPESKLNDVHPNIVGSPNTSHNSSSIRNDEAPPSSGIIPNAEVPLSKNPKTGMPNNILGISLIFVFSGIAVLIHKKQ